VRVHHDALPDTLALLIAGGPWRAGRDQRLAEVSRALREPQDPVHHDRSTALRHARRNGGFFLVRRCSTDWRVRAFVTNALSHVGRVHASRSSMLTGQFPSTHGAWMNGVPLAIDAPSVAETLHDAATRRRSSARPTSNPSWTLRSLRRERARQSRYPTIEQDWFDGRRGVHRGFDYLEFATHGVMGALHYAKWIRDEHPDAMRGFYQVVDADST